jgi:archaellum component FlaF (FlaF/FlaG flagellin family)
MGFGTIVASMIMFIAVLVLSTSMYAVMKDDISEQSTALRQQTKYTSNHIQTQVNIESLNYNNKTNTTTVNIRNTGSTKLSLTLTDIYVNYDFIPRNTSYRIIQVDPTTDYKNPGIWDPNEIVEVKVYKDLETGEFPFKIAVQYGVSEEETFSVAYG